MLLSVADFIGVSKASACRIVRDISFAIARLYNKYIFMHTNTEEDFYGIARFPRVLGAVDGTHIRIQSPSKNLHNFYSVVSSTENKYLCTCAPVRVH